MNWTGELEDWGVMVLLAGGLYVVGGWLFRSLHPTGMLNWQGRRLTKVGAAIVLLAGATADVHSHLDMRNIGLAMAVALWSVLGFLALLLVRWWWRDRQKEKAAYQALVEKVHQEGRELAAPPMSAGRKAWRWVVNGYAIFLVAAGLYALVHYLLKRF